MKKLNIIILLSTLILISFSVTSNAQVNILINSSEYPKNRKFAKGLYHIILNLIDNKNALDNTNFKYDDGVILIPMIGDPYISNPNIP